MSIRSSAYDRSAIDQIIEAKCKLGRDKAKDILVHGPIDTGDSRFRNENDIIGSQ